MNDREFTELLNLYLDREISAEDALRLEAEVLARPDRRELYTQYCRMHKACSMLGEEFSKEVAAPAAERSAWGFGPLMAGLAAAAAVAFVGIRWGGFSQAPAVPPLPSQTLAVAPAPARDAMQPVFQTRPVLAPAARSSAASFVSYSPDLQSAQLNWIGDVHLAPLAVAPSAVVFAPKTDLRSAALNDAQAARDAQQPADMAAFRFQR